MAARIKRALGTSKLKVLLLVALVAAGVSASVVVLGNAKRPTTLATLKAPGTYTWTVPRGVKRVRFDVFGASGGDVVSGNTLASVGGAGGEATGTFAVTPAETFEIVVGGQGGDNSGATGGRAGFNGGGQGGDATYQGALGGGGGGGGTDVRIGGIGNSCVSGESCRYPDRIIVGGGGGGGGSAFGTGTDGGAGGGVSGASGRTTEEMAGNQGFQKVGGSCGSCGDFANGSFGTGGDGQVPCPGGSPCNVESAGGGGGGWYGGAAALTSGGGGGSGFISRSAVSGSFPGRTQAGDGKVIVSTP